MWHKEFGGDDGSLFYYRELEEDGTFSLGNTVNSEILASINFGQWPRSDILARY